MPEYGVSSSVRVTIKRTFCHSLEIRTALSQMQRRGRLFRSGHDRRCRHLCSTQRSLARSLARTRRGHRSMGSAMPSRGVCNTSGCNPPYKGPLCAMCNVGSHLLSGRVCAPCPPPGVNAAITGAIMLGAGAAFISLIYDGVIGAGKHRGDRHPPSTLWLCARSFLTCRSHRWSAFMTCNCLARWIRS